MSINICCQVGRVSWNGIANLETQHKAVIWGEHLMQPDTPHEHRGSSVGLFSLNGIFKAGCFAGLITTNHTWGAECSCAETLSFPRGDCSPTCGPRLGWGLDCKESLS